MTGQLTFAWHMGAIAARDFTVPPSYMTTESSPYKLDRLATFDAAAARIY